MKSETATTRKQHQSGATAEVGDVQWAGRFAEVLQHEHSQATFIIQAGLDWAGEKGKCKHYLEKDLFIKLIKKAHNLKSWQKAQYEIYKES